MAESHERREVASKVRKKAEERLLVGELRVLAWSWRGREEKRWKWRKGMANFVTTFIALPT